MEDFIVTKKRRIVLCTVATITSAEMRGGIQFKIPSDFEIVDEIMFSAVDPAAVNSVEIFGSNAKNNVLGHLSLHLNNRDSHPLNWKVQIKPHANLLRKHEGLSLLSPLGSNTLIQGYYIDAATSPKYPYDLKIYLSGIHNQEKRKHV